MNLNLTTIRQLQSGCVMNDHRPLLGKFSHVLRHSDYCDCICTNRQLKQNFTRGVTMRRMLLTVVIASSVSWAQAQTALPSSAMPSEKVALSTIHAGGDVVKASTMRLDTSGRHAPASTAPKAAARDEGEHPLRMVVAALLLMVAIGVRRFRSGKP
jgi:hypothetical protein